MMNKKSKLIIISISAFFAGLLIFISIFFSVKYYQKKKKAKETADLTLEVKKLKDEYQELKKNFEAHYHEINNYNDLGFSSEKEKEEFNFIKKTNQNKDICNNKAVLLDQKQCLSNLNSDFNHANTLLDKTKQKKQQILGEINDLWSNFQTQKEKAKKNIDEIESFDLSIYDDETKDKFNKCIKHFKLLDSGNDVDDFDTLLAKKEYFQQLLISAKENQNDSEELISQYKTDKENFITMLNNLEEKVQLKLNNSEINLPDEKFDTYQCLQIFYLNSQKECFEKINRDINKKNIESLKKKSSDKFKYFRNKLNRFYWFGLYNQYDTAIFNKSMETLSSLKTIVSNNSSIYSNDSAVEEVKDKYKFNFNKFSEFDKYVSDNIRDQIENINKTNVYAIYSILENNNFFNSLKYYLNQVNKCTDISNLSEKSSENITYFNQVCTDALYLDTLTNLKKYVSESIKKGTRNIFYLTSSWLKASFHTVTVLSLLSLSFFGFKLIRKIVLKEFLLAIINTILIINQPIIIGTLYLVYLSSWFKSFIAGVIGGTILSIFLAVLGAKKYFVGFQNFRLAAFAIIQTFNFVFNFGGFYVSSIFGFHQYEGLESYHCDNCYVFDNVEVDDVEVKEKKIVREIAEKITKKNIAAIAKQDQEYAVPNWFIPKRKVISFIVSVFAFTTSTLLFIYLKFFFELSKVDGAVLNNANVGGGAGGDVPK